MRERRIRSEAAAIRTAGALPALCLLLLFLVAAPSATACRYNVRDIGFVDLEPEPYHLYLFVPSEASSSLRSLLQELPGAVLRDCNVQAAAVASDSPMDHPARQFFPAQTSAGEPSAVLVSPDGRALSWTLSEGNQGYRENLEKVLSDVATSPKREELVAAASRAFAAVLCIEGEDAAANERARQAIARSAEAIRATLRTLPKPIAEPPALVVIGVADLARERVLLWSLGLDPVAAAQPRAAIVYGRARWMGPLMKGDEIAEPNLTGLLSIIGADCECGLDVAWTLGTRLPVRWDDVRYAQVSKALGFDPENPLVKTEVSRIAGRARSLHTPSLRQQGVVLAGDPIPTVGAGVLTGGVGRGLGGGRRVEPGAEPPSTAGQGPVARRALVFLFGLTATMAVAGLFLLWRARNAQMK